MMTTELTSTNRRSAAVAGVHEDADPADIVRHYPGTTVGRLFVPRLQPPRDLLPSIIEMTEPWRDLGMDRVYVSYKPRPADVAAGSWDGFHRRLGAWLADHPAVRIIVHHEPEGGRDRVESGAFARMFARARGEMKNGWAGAHVVYCAMAYQWRPKGDAARAPRHWKEVVADEYLCDVYSGDSFPETAILPDHDGFNGWFGAIVRPRLAAGEAVEWGIGERGFMAEDDRVRARTIRNESAWLNGDFDRHDATGQLIDRPPNPYLAWSSPGAQNNPAWVLAGASADAMRELIATFVRQGHSVKR